MKVIAVIVQKSGDCKATPSIATTVAAVADRLSAVVVDLDPPPKPRPPRCISAHIALDQQTCKLCNIAT